MNLRSPRSSPVRDELDLRTSQIRLHSMTGRNGAQVHGVSPRVPNYLYCGAIVTGGLRHRCRDRQGVRFCRRVRCRAGPPSHPGTTGAGRARRRGDQTDGSHGPGLDRVIRRTIRSLWPSPSHPRSKCRHWWPPLSCDSRGYESHFAANHIGHFDLVSRLRPALRRAEGARVVIVFSWAHRSSDIVFDHPNYQRRDYDPITAYVQSKTANILFAVALDEMSRNEGVRAFSLHPGTIVDTRFSRDIPRGVLEAVGMVNADGAAVLDPSKGWKSVEQGAAAPSFIDAPFRHPNGGRWSTLTGPPSNFRTGYRGGKQFANAVVQGPHPLLAQDSFHRSLPESRRLSTLDCHNGRTRTGRLH